MQKTTLNDWLLRAFVFVGTALMSVILYMAKEIREDVKLLSKTDPVQQQQIKNLEDRTGNLEHKVFANNQVPYPAKHEDIVTLQSLLNIR